MLSPVEALEPRSGCPLAGGGRHRGAEQPQLLRRGTGAAALCFFDVWGLCGYTCVWMLCAAAVCGMSNMRWAALRSYVKLTTPGC